MDYYIQYPYSHIIRFYCYLIMTVITILRKQHLNSTCHNFIRWFIKLFYQNLVFKFRVNIIYDYLNLSDEIYSFLLFVHEKRTVRFMMFNIHFSFNNLIFNLLNKLNLKFIFFCHLFFEINQFIIQ